MEKLHQTIERLGLQIESLSVALARENLGAAKLPIVTQKPSKVKQRVQSINASVAASSGVAPSAAVHGSATTKGSKEKQIAEAPIAAIPGWEAVATRKKKQTLPEAAVKTLEAPEWRFTLGEFDWVGEGKFIPQRTFETQQETEASIAFASILQVRAALGRSPVNVPQALICAHPVDGYGIETIVPRKTS